MRRFAPPLVALAGMLAVGSACAESSPEGDARAAGAPPGAPLETRAANAPYKPAFAGQTRAPGVRSAATLDVRPAVKGLDRPWAVEFLPDGRMIITEKEGRLRIADREGRLSPAVSGVPAVSSAGQGGLLDVAVDPDFARNQTIFFSYSEPRTDGNGTALARARLVDGAQPRLTDVRVIFRQLPSWRSNLHFGSRIVFAADGTLFLTLGERSLPATRVMAQDLSTHFGKVVRIAKDGSVPRDNPFVGRAGAKPEIWSYGHRNIQAAALRPGSNQLWTIEHGPRGGDELNLAQAGKNYGWPVVNYGMEYSGEKMPGGATAQTGMEQPVYYWDPVIAPSGMIFYTGDLFPAWKGSIFVGGLASERLVRLAMDGDRVVGEEWLLQDQGERVRDVAQGPDGAIYVAVDGGSILRLAPKP